MPRSVDARAARAPAATTSARSPRQDALAEVTELDHEQHAVDAAAGPRGRDREPAMHVELGVAADVGVLDDALDLAEHRRADRGSSAP